MLPPSSKGPGFSRCRNAMKYLFYLILFIAIERFCYFQTGTFSLSKMVHDKAPSSLSDDTSPLTLTQPLRFIGAGKQFYAFETADHQYVVKFLKWNRRRTLPFLSFLSSHVKTREKRATSILESCKLALEQISLETQLIKVKPLAAFTLIDKLGITHTVPAEHVHFCVQRKALPFAAAYNRSLLPSFIETVASQCKKGVRNLDPKIERNYGILDGQIVLLDIGSLAKLTQPVSYELVLELLPLRAFLQKHHPEDITLFDNLLKNFLQEMPQSHGAFSLRQRESLPSPSP